MEEEHPERIIGYYTLAAASVALDRLPEETRKTLPRYQDIPSILLGGYLMLLIRKTPADKSMNRLLALSSVHLILYLATYTILPGN